MITLTFSYNEYKKTNTYELKCDAVDGSPFVKDADDVFLNIASPSDMSLLPDTPSGALYRSNTITLIFRENTTVEYTKADIEKQIAELNKVVLSDVVDSILFESL